MPQIIDKVLLDDVLREAAALGEEERHARIRRCVAEARHAPGSLPICVEPASAERIPYCDRCWSLIDAEGLTWGRLPERPQ